MEQVLLAWQVDDELYPGGGTGDELYPGGPPGAASTPLLCDY